MYIITKILKNLKENLSYLTENFDFNSVINKKDGKNMMLYDRKYKTL